MSEQHENLLAPYKALFDKHDISYEQPTSATICFYDQPPAFKGLVAVGRTTPSAVTAEFLAELFDMHEPDTLNDITTVMTHPVVDLGANSADVALKQALFNYLIEQIYVIRVEPVASGSIVITFTLCAVNLAKGYTYRYPQIITKAMVG